MPPAAAAGPAAAVEGRQRHGTCIPVAICAATLDHPCCSKAGKKPSKPAGVEAGAAATQAPVAVPQPGRPAAAARQRPAAEAPAPLHLLAALAALAALVYSYHAAASQLASQTGDWLATSFCGLALFAAAVVAAAVGLAVEEARAAFAAARGSTVTPSGVAVAAWWAAAGAALLVAAAQPADLAGARLLAPALAAPGGRRITDAELTLRSMAVAAAAFGPLFAALGCAAGACASRALRRLALARHPLLLLLPLLVGTAVAALLHGLPPVALPPWPATTLPPAVAALAALIAAALSPRGSSRGSALLAAAGVAAVAALLGTGLHRPCGPVDRQLDGGRYRLLWQCSAAAGGQVSVVEGTAEEQYR